MNNESNSILDKINSPDDLKKFSVRELEALGAEIRNELISVVSRNGGHLAPNLGIVELTIALHYVFQSPSDKIIWDVGHQAYVHKILTGRKEFFKTLRKAGGCAGFPMRDESPHDPFGTGHAGTAISAALGMAAARDNKGENYKIVAVVGDGSLNCGISLEGLNNISEVTKDFIVILNDNKMSISKNVGAIPQYLNRLISGKSYNRFKAFTKMMLKRVPHGDEISQTISNLGEATKGLFVPGVFFEELGLRYIGPVQGHNLPELIRTLDGVKDSQKPVIIHVLTEKGCGYFHAEAQPEKFHGISKFDPCTGDGYGPEKISFSSAFGQTMLEIAEKHHNAVAISAAMRSGTGLLEFSEKFPDRFYDVGIAEEHAAIFAAGLAAEGVIPFTAIYSTFLNRALDCIYHDVCLQNLPVIFCCDRSGIVEDGPTHHGIHDVAFLRVMPNICIMYPKDETELRNMLYTAVELKKPVVIKYPRGGTGRKFLKDLAPEFLAEGRAEIVKNGSDLSIWASGAEVWTAMKIAEILYRSYSIEASVVNMRFLKPFDSDMLRKMALSAPLVTLEDAHVSGGLAVTVDEILINEPHKKIMHFGWNDVIVPHGEMENLRLSGGMDVESLVLKIVNGLKGS